jgi:hypothetical protein
MALLNYSNKYGLLCKIMDKYQWNEDAIKKNSLIVDVKKEI